MTQALALRPSELPDIAVAMLPAAYEHAKTALMACNSLDECKGWANKMAALASYAKQSDDETLMHLALRIRARATKRCGELLQTFQQDKGGDRKSVEYQTVGTYGLISQRQAAAQAGMSEHQELQAVRVSNVPEADFEALVEDEYPPTITELAKIGKRAVVPPSTPQRAETEPQIDYTGHDTARRVPGAPSNGMQFARIAIMKLEEIRDDDLERQQAFDDVLAWLTEHRAAPEITR